MLGKKVLITGANGFVGSEIVRHFESRGEEVWSLVNQKSSRNTENGEAKERTISVDITNAEVLSELLNIGSIDICVHAAGLAHQFGKTKREDFYNVNVFGTKNVLETAFNLGVKHFILISSVSVYGHGKHKYKGEFEDTQPIVETIECAPEDFYAESKLESENTALGFCRDKSIKLTILRLATVIGEEDKGNLLRLIKAIDSRRFVWIGRGENYKSFVHRSDVARACGAVLQNQQGAGEIFNVSADFLQMREIVEIISRKLGVKPPGFRIPSKIFNLVFRLNKNILAVDKIKTLEKTIGKWLAEDVYSAEKIKQKCAFEPQISARRAVEREVEWYMEGK